MRPIGELTLMLAGTVTKIRCFKTLKMWPQYFESKKFFNTLKRDFMSFNWESCNIYLDLKEVYKIKGNKAIKEGDLL